MLRFILALLAISGASTVGAVNRSLEVDGTYLPGHSAEVRLTQYSIAQNNTAPTYYYVSPSGSDAAAGTSPATAWQTIGKVNGFTFPGNSFIQFQGGQSFTGCLTFRGNGNAPGTIYITNYGAGVATINPNCNGTISPVVETAAIILDGVNNSTLDGLKLVGQAAKATPTGVMLDNNTGTTAYNITIKNMDISGFSTAIFLNGDPFSGSCPTVAFSGVTVSNNTIHGASATSSDDNGIYGFGCDNVFTGHDMWNLTVQGNTITNLGGTAATTISGFGIDVDGWDGATVAHNLVHDIGANATSCGGPSAFQAYNTSHITIRQNEAYNVTPNPSYSTGCDWVGYDCDGATASCIVEYNYSHNNFGCGYLAFVADVNGFTWGTNIFRYNISENDNCGFNFEDFGGYLGKIVHVYNNTFWEGAITGVNFGRPYCIFWGGTTSAAGSYMANNVCAVVTSSHDSSTFFIGENITVSSPTAPTWYNNTWFCTDGCASGSQWQWFHTTTSFSAWEADSGETGGLTSDPLFTSDGSGGTCSWTPSALTGPQPCPSNYNYQSMSPLKAAGRDLTTSPSSFNLTGVTDYYGFSISHANIGHYAGP